MQCSVPSYSRSAGPRRSFGRGWRVLAGSVAVLLTALAAEATPINTFHTVFVDSSGNLVPGTITASLDLYVRPYGTGPFGCCSPLGPASLVDQFSLGIGSDFTVVIPQVIVNTHASWEVPIPAGSLGIPGWPQPGLNWTVQKHPGGTDVASLDDWCTTPAGPFVDGVFVAARRGGICSFADKVSHIQTGNGVGAIIVNNIPGAGAQGMSLGTFVPAIPVIGLSYERGEQFMLALNATGADTIPELVYFDFSARWDPDPPVPTAAPEPATLALLAVGLAWLTARRARLRN